jgi:hypothetical protein
MKKIFVIILMSQLLLSSCEFARPYGKHGRCNADTKSGSQCKNNAGKNGYCGTHSR